MLIEILATAFIAALVGIAVLGHVLVLTAVLPRANRTASVTDTGSDADLVIQ